MKYQILPPLPDDDFQRLKESIQQHGVLVPLVLDDEGNVLDGHHRLKAVEELKEAGVQVQAPPPAICNLDEEDKLERVLSLNVDRRHLTREQRQNLVVRLRERGWSFQRIAKRLGFDTRTIRDDVDLAGGGFPPPAAIIGEDGKTYTPLSALARIPEPDRSNIATLLHELASDGVTPAALRALSRVAAEIVHTDAIDDGSGEQRRWSDLTPDQKRVFLMANLEEDAYERHMRHKQRTAKMNNYANDPLLDKLIVPKEQLLHLRRLAKHAPIKDKKEYENKWRDKL